MGIEKKIEDLRNMTLPVLMKVLQPPQARLQVAVFVDMIIRSILPKPWAKDMNIKLPIGRHSEETHQKMGHIWAKLVEEAHPEVESLSKVCGFAAYDDETDDSLGRELDLEKVTKLKGLLQNRWTLPSSTGVTKSLC